jgi:hypothetical protein
MEGHRSTEIARILNAQGIPSPSVYLISKGHKNRWPRRIDPDYCFWSTSVVRGLIENEVYLGKVVSNKSRVLEPGTGRTVSRPKKEWLVVPNAHEPIVSEKDFQKAQLMLPRREYDHEPENVFGKKIRCEACGHAMKRQSSKNPRYKCNTVKVTSHYGCQGYSIEQIKI